VPLLDLRQARAELRLGEVLELLGWTRRAGLGEQLRGPCPVHGARSPASRSFAAHLGKNVWHCFVCGASGTRWTCGPRRPGSRSILQCWNCMRDLLFLLGRQGYA
jgi:hypothetical protein